MYFFEHFTIPDTVSDMCSSLSDIDATGRPNSGLTLGKLVWLRSYARCKTIPGAHYCLAPGVAFTINSGGNITKIPGYKRLVCAIDNDKYHFS